MKVNKILIDADKPKSLHQTPTKTVFLSATPPPLGSRSQLVDVFLHKTRVNLGQRPDRDRFSYCLVVHRTRGTVVLCTQITTCVHVQPMYRCIQKLNDASFLEMCVVGFHSTGSVFVNNDNNMV